MTSEMLIGGLIAAPVYSRGSVMLILTFLSLMDLS